MVAGQTEVLRKALSTAPQEGTQEPYVLAGTSNYQVLGDMMLELKLMWETCCQFLMNDHCRRFSHSVSQNV